MVPMHRNPTRVRIKAFYKAEWVKIPQQLCEVVKPNYRICLDVIFAVKCSINRIKGVVIGYATNVQPGGPIMDWSL